MARLVLRKSKQRPSVQVKRTRKFSYTPNVMEIARKWAYVGHGEDAYGRRDHFRGVANIKTVCLEIDAQAVNLHIFHSLTTLGLQWSPTSFVFLLSSAT